MKYQKTVQCMAAAALCAALCISRPLSVLATSQGLKAAQEQKSALEAEKKKTQETLKELQGLKSNTQQYVKKLDANLTSLEAELTSLSDQIDKKEVEIKKTGEELEAAKETEQAQYESMKLRIQYMYERRETSFLDLLMQSESVTQLLGRAEYVNEISKYDRKMLVAYGEAKDAVAQKEATLKEEQEKLMALEDSTKAKRASVEELLADKQSELSSYNSKISTAQSQIAGFEADIQAQEEKMKQIEAEIKRKEEEARKKAEEERKKAEEAAKKAAQAKNKTTSPTKQTYETKSLGNIKFQWPCPSSSRITSGFGARSSPTEGASSNHKGIDISAPTGAAIVAAADGTVVISTYSSSAGNYIMIDHGGGVSTVYMHCSQLLVSQGATVKKGQTIAKVGSTGYSTGSHLHFGIRSGGVYVNPRSYVSP